MILNFCNSVVIKLIKMYFPPIPKIQSSKNLRRIKISQFFYRGIFVQDVRSAVSVSLGCSYCRVCLLWNLFPFLKNHRTLCVALALLLALQIQVKIFRESKNVTDGVMVIFLCFKFRVESCSAAELANLCCAMYFSSCQSLHCFSVSIIQKNLYPCVLRKPYY